MGKASSDHENAAARLESDHAAVAASLARLADFVQADDEPLAREEWNELEARVLAHLNAEEMFLLPGFERDQAVSARTIRLDHERIREMLGEMAIAVDLHILRPDSVHALSEVLTTHVGLETRTLYPWAKMRAEGNALGALIRRIGAPPRDETHRTLGAILQACDDGQHGYRTAAEDVADQGCRLMFNHYAEQRAEFTRALLEALQGLGVPSIGGSSPAAAVHRGWMGARAALTQGSAKAVLAECRRGEDAALRTYRAALRADLPPAIRELVQDQYEAVKKARDEVSTLMDSSG
jgi:uncharacterized protein (TIGR02284 family)